MKNFKLKASVLAIAVALPGTSFAGTITFGTTDADTNNYAQELNYNATAVPAGISITASDIGETLLGFGVSSGQNRYAQIKLTNAKFAAPVSTSSFKDITASDDLDGSTPPVAVPTGTSGFGADNTVNDGVTIVSGGAGGDTCIVYQVTGKDSVGNASADTVQWTYPNLNITSTSGPAQATYTLHETAASASCSTGNNSSVLSTAVTGNLATFASSLVFSGANGTTVTADVIKLYKEEKDSTGGASDTLQLQLGALTTDILDTNLEADDSAVDQADLITAATLTVNGDFTAVGTTGSVTLSSTPCNTPTIVATGVLAGDKQSAVFSGAPILGLFANAPSAALVNNVCYNTDGSTPIQVDTYTASIAFTAQTTPLATLGSISEQPAGIVERDGTILKVPFSQGTAGQTTFINLANMGSVDAPFTTRCFTGPGTGAPTAGFAGTVLAGNTKKLKSADLLCAAGTNAVEFTLAVPSGNVVGTFVRQNNTTGDSGMSDVTGNQ